MGKTFVFKSIARPSWRYRVYESDSENPAHDWKRSRYGISSYLSQYDTMNDGEVQHSPDCNVNTEDVIDVVNSLACSLHLMNFDARNEELCQADAILKWFWRCEPSVDDKTIRFLRGIKFNEKKDTYISFYEGCSKSHSESKKYDKRWIKVEPRYTENETEETMILSLIHTGETGCKPYGIITYIATVMRISEICCNDSGWHWSAVNELKRGSVFKDVPNGDMHTFLDNFERITMYKRALDMLGRSISYSIRYRDQLAMNAADKKELEVA